LIRASINLGILEERRKMDHRVKPGDDNLNCIAVIARSEATKQSRDSWAALDCFAQPVIGRRFAPTRWLAMTHPSQFPRIGERKR
jgi:hypothetical protein